MNPGCVFIFCSCSSKFPISSPRLCVSGSHDVGPDAARPSCVRSHRRKPPRNALALSPARQPAQPDVVFERAVSVGQMAKLHGLHDTLDDHGRAQLHVRPAHVDHQHAHDGTQLASTSAASFASASRQPASLSTVGTPGGSPSCTARISVPPSASASEIVIVISPRSAGSVVSNSTTSTTRSFATSFRKRPWYVSVCAVVLPVPVAASYVSEIRNEPPSRGLKACTWLVMPVGTIHVATARALRSAR